MKKLFIIGDSISIHYHDELSRMLTGIVECSRKTGDGDINGPTGKGANGGTSDMVLDYLRQEKELGICYETLVVNCGLHDIRRSRIDDHIFTPVQQYRENLYKIVELGKTMAQKLIWVNTTPVVDKIHNARELGFLRYNRDVTKYNKTAARVMGHCEVPEIDLYHFTQSFGKDAYCDHVHYIPQVRALQAAFLVGALLQLIPESRE